MCGYPHHQSLRGSVPHPPSAITQRHRVGWDPPAPAENPHWHQSWHQQCLVPAPGASAGAGAFTWCCHWMLAQVLVLIGDGSTCGGGHLLDETREGGVIRRLRQLKHSHHLWPAQTRKSVAIVRHMRPTHTRGWAARWGSGGESLWHAYGSGSAEAPAERTGGRRVTSKRGSSENPSEQLFQRSCGCGFASGAAAGPPPAAVVL